MPVSQHHSYVTMPRLEADQIGLAMRISQVPSAASYRSFDKLVQLELKKSTSKPWRTACVLKWSSKAAFRYSLR
jgi:hypothetical protein